jgi:uncharacterized repeat protein (TIGR01451 family)
MSAHCRCAVLTVVLVCAGGVLSASAFAVEPRPGWEVTSTTFPTDLAPSGGTGTLEVNVYNIGAEKSTGPVTVTDVLPPGVVATEAGDVQNNDAERFNQDGLWECYGNAPGESPRKADEFEAATVVTCINNPGVLLSLPVLDPPNSTSPGSGAIEHIGIAVKTVTSEQETLTNRVTVAGGGASASASTVSPVTVSSVTTPAFGFQDLDGWFSNADGTLDTQAGSHPYEFMFSFDLNTLVNQNYLEHAHGKPRNLAVNLPPGFIGNPTAVPRCTRLQFDNEECDPSTQVGVDIANALPAGKLVPFRAAFALYNLVPPPGVPAQFGFVLAGIQVFLDASVRSGSDDGITIHVDDLPQGKTLVNIMGNRAIFWGEPSDPSHDGYRFATFWENEKCGSRDPGNGCSSSAPRVPFLTLPTSCAGSHEFTTSLNTWETADFGEGSFLTHDSNDIPTGFTGCDHLTFGPSISAAPDTSKTDTPAGLTVDVRAAQEGLSTPGALTTSDIKDTTVTLPPGMVINPGQAAGLQACQFSESGLGVEPTASEPSRGAPNCPNASKVGTDEAETPILFKPLKGNVYVLPSTPPHVKLLAVLSGEGVNIKLVLDVELDEQTGQITTHVANIPEAPVNDFKISFSGGAQAALATPTQCGTNTTTSDFTPWSTPTVGDVFPTSSFSINTGSDGGACPVSPLPFSPVLTAGSTTDQAGGFTNFSLLLQRGDGQQRISGLQFKAPQGLSGMLSQVPLCGEPQAAQGTCSAASQIGHASVAAGPGPYPLTIPQPGNPESPIYLTGPYEGAPFGLTIVTHVLAGPFNLGNVITRARVEVDRHTAQITVTTDPLPQVIDGVPTDLRLVDSVIDRPGFMFNPTNCNPSSFSGTAYGTPPPGAGGPGASAPISSPFQVGSCQSLKFKPSFKVTTSGKTSRSKGASLDAKVIYPAVPLAANQAAGEANIASVKVDLPKQLPSRLTTLQKACTAAQFNANPAGCPSASVIGHATAITQVLPVPLTGPAIFVSHGGEAFPSLIIVLQGYGVTVDLVATTFISHAGITSSTFKTLPDVPFKSFDLNLPEGKYSALAANGNLCTSKLAMPTAFVGQNGAVIHESTPIAVTGCAKKKALTRAQKLTRALKVCHKKAKGKQAACVKTAHRRYGPLRKAGRKRG